METKWCPRCHKKVEIPDFIKNMNITGTINIGCGNCKAGKVIIYGKTSKKNEKDVRGEEIHSGDISIRSIKEGEEI